MIQHLTSVQVPEHSQVFGLSLLNSNKIITVDGLSIVRVWDSRSLENQISQQLHHSYLTSICPTPHCVLVGTGEGKLLILDRNTLQPHSTVKLHEDSINDIKIFENEVVTVGSDGLLSIYDLKGNKQIKTVDAGSPLSQVQKYKGKYYLGGVRSFQVNNQYTIKKCSEVSRFLATQNRLFGTSDEKGFFAVSPKFNTYVPCENMIQFNKGILGTSWSTVSYFSVFEDDDRISYRSMFLKKMQEGESFTALSSLGKRVFAGSDCGKIYAFSVNEDYHCYD